MGKLNFKNTEWQSRFKQFNEKVKEEKKSKELILQYLLQRYLCCYLE